jgi:hypothetical protein
MLIRKAGSKDRSLVSLDSSYGIAPALVGAAAGCDLLMLI